MSANAMTHRRENGKGEEKKKTKGGGGRSHANSPITGVNWQGFTRGGERRAQKGVHHQNEKNSKNGCELSLRGLERTPGKLKVETGERGVDNRSAIEDLDHSK